MTHGLMSLGEQLMYLASEASPSPVQSSMSFLCSQTTSVVAECSKFAPPPKKTKKKQKGKLLLTSFLSWTSASESQTSIPNVLSKHHLVQLTVWTERQTDKQTDATDYHSTWTNKYEHILTHFSSDKWRRAQNRVSIDD